MKVEVLVATMHQSDHHILEKMNIQTDAVVVNQCEKEDYEEINFNGNKIKFISRTERGLSRSRNIALENATGDICIIADEDIIYENNYQETIKKAYENLPQADIIVFDIAYDNPQIIEMKFGTEQFKMGLRRAMQVNSVRITFKLNAILNNKIIFNSLFGAGSIYSHGEENIFIKECLKKGLAIYYYPQKIATVCSTTSTWFNGYNQKYFFDTGVIYYELFGGTLYLPFAIRLLLRKRKQLKDSTLIQNITAIVAGKKEYKRRKRKNEEN